MISQYLLKNRKNFSLFLLTFTPFKTLIFWCEKWYSDFSQKYSLFFGYLVESHPNRCIQLKTRLFFNSWLPMLTIPITLRKIYFFVQFSHIL